MSIRKVIVDNLPYTWEIVLRKEKVLSKFVDYCYEHNITKGKRNAKFAPENAAVLKRLLRYYESPHMCISSRITKEGCVFWEKISETCRTLNEAYR